MSERRSDEPVFPIPTWAKVVLAAAVTTGVGYRAYDAWIRPDECPTPVLADNPWKIAREIGGIDGIFEEAGETDPDKKRLTTMTEELQRRYESDIKVGELVILPDPSEQSIEESIRCPIPPNE